MSLISRAGRRPPLQCLLAIWLLGTALALPLAAQTIPGLSAIGKSAATPAKPAASEPSAEEWTARLASAQSEHRELLAQAEGSAPLLAERQLASARRLVLLTSKVDALAQRGASEASPEPSATPVQALAGPAPYDLLDVDRLRDRLDALTAQQAALTLNLKTLDETIQAALKGHADADANLRVRRGQAAREARSDVGGELRAQVELADLVSQVADLELVQADDSRRRTRERLSAIAEPIAQLRAEIERVHRQVRLDDGDLNRILKGIAADRQSLTAAGAKLAERLARLEAEPADQDSSHRREIDALTLGMRNLRELEANERTKELIWRGRRELTTPDFDLEHRLAADARLNAVLDALQERRRALSEERRLLRFEERSQLALSATLPSDDAGHAVDQRSLTALRTRLDTEDQLRDGLDQTIVLVNRARADLAVNERPATAQEWLSRVWAALSRTAVAVWQFEMFSAPETTLIGGRPVTVDHTVTVGTSIGLLLLMFLGYWLAGRLSSGLTRLLVRRWRLSAELASVTRRWMNSILVIAAVLLVLKIARIPLTGFAFLGGALAIGVGFGTQNIIKNLISGVILLFERKIRVGDIVAIGGIAGTVTTVDFRATTLRGFDGIDAIIPNSNLLENQITNWSGGGTQVRREVAVGVAYGCDVRLAAKLVSDCAISHTLVLNHPAPQVLFADFGSDALLLKLQYWLDFSGPRAGPVVDSDLRYAIDDALREADIAIAFPQRDVHLDVRGPLQVDLIAPTSQGPRPKS